MKGILGKKVGMTQIFDESGKLIPVTVVDVCDNRVLVQKTENKDGYNATQLGFDSAKEKSLSKAEVGHTKKSQSSPKRFIKEIESDVLAGYSVGSVVLPSIFSEGEIVDVTGMSKGKGFQGVIKRYGFHRGPSAHGSGFHRGIGSMGSIDPASIKKGKKMPGRTGGEQVTIQNLKIAKIDNERNVILIQGNIPGANRNYVIIKSGIKQEV
jgi:large subunit ribosomal protein L3